MADSTLSTILTWGAIGFGAYLLWEYFSTPAMAAPASTSGAVQVNGSNIQYAGNPIQPTTVDSGLSYDLPVGKVTPITQAVPLGSAGNIIVGAPASPVGAPLGPMLPE